MIKEGKDIKVIQNLKALNKYWDQWVGVSVNRKIFSASITFSFLTLMAKSLGALKEVISAAVFGIGDSLDAFNLSFTLASFVMIVIGSAFQIGYIPIYLEAKVKEGVASAQRLFAATFMLCFLFLFTATLILILSLPHLLPTIATGFDAQKLMLTTKLFYSLVPLILLGGLAFVIIGTLNAEENFKFAALSPGITAIFTILILAFFGKTIGIYALAGGVVSGALCEFIFLNYALNSLGIRIHLPLVWKDQRIKKLIANAVPIIGASSISGLMPIVDQAFAAKLQRGDIAALGFGYRIIGLFLTLFAAAVNTVVLPYFSQLAAERNWNLLKQTFKTNIYKFILPVTLIASLTIVLCSEPFTRFLFQRGQFTPQDTKSVAAIQSMYALQLPAYVIYMVSVRLLSAINASGRAIVAAVFSLVLTIFMDYQLSSVLGAKGIALATSLVYTSTMIVTLILVYLEINKREAYDIENR